MMNKINRILSWPFVALIRLYQRFISPYKAPSCRFTPTCSVYAVTALREWGPVIGILLAVWRILRCNPFSKGGSDPVPVPWWKRKKTGDAKSVSGNTTDGDAPSDDQTQRK